MPTTEHDGELVGDAHPTEPRSGERHAEDLSPSREVGGSERSDGEGLAREALSEPAARLSHGESNAYGDGPAAGALPLAGKEDDAGTSLRSVRPTDGGESPQHEHTLAQLREVRTRADTTTKYSDEDWYSVLSTALDHLALGRTWLLEAEFVRFPSRDDMLLEGRESFSDERLTTSEAGSTEKDSRPFAVSDLLAHATTHLNESVKLLRQAGRQDELPRGLLHRAALWRVMLAIECEGQGASRRSGSPATQKEPAASASTLTKDPQELLDNADKDLTEVETIAERGSMLRWQIEAALERTRLYLMLASANSASLRFESESDKDGNAESQRTQSDWLEMARMKLAETQRLVKQTERPYEPYTPMDEIWEDHPEGETWDPPGYVGVFKKGDIVGYHCRNEEIAWLEQTLAELETT